MKKNCRNVIRSPLLGSLLEDVNVELAYVWFETYRTIASRANTLEQHPPNISKTMLTDSSGNAILAIRQVIELMYNLPLIHHDPNITPTELQTREDVAEECNGSCISMSIVDI